MELTQSLVNEVINLSETANKVLKSQPVESKASIIASRFFREINYDTLEADIEVLEELRNVCSRQGDGYEQTLDSILILLNTILDTSESLNL